MNEKSDDLLEVLDVDVELDRRGNVAANDGRVCLKLVGDKLVVFEGAVDLVRRRAERGVVGIVSGALRSEIEHALAVMDVRESIAFIVAAEDTKRCKPDPEGYVLGLQALARSGLPGRGPAVVIEDSIAGIEAAKAAGLRCAAVAHSYPTDRLRAAGADVVALRLVDLTDDLLDGVVR